MTDDLVKRLRDPRYDGQLMMRRAAADRIEELEQAFLTVLGMLSEPLSAEEKCEMAYQYLSEMYPNDR